jgi:hypothetical protein
MSSDSLFLVYLPHVGTALSLVLLFVLTAIWLKSTVRGFGLMALGEVFDLASRAVGPWLSSRGMDYNLVSFLWIAGGVARLIGAYLLYKYYLYPESITIDTEEAK